MERHLNKENQESVSFHHQFGEQEIVDNSKNFICQNDHHIRIHSPDIRHSVRGSLRNHKGRRTRRTHRNRRIHSDDDDGRDDGRQIYVQVDQKLGRLSRSSKTPPTNQKRQSKSI